MVLLYVYIPVGRLKTPQESLTKNSPRAGTRGGAGGGGQGLGRLDAGLALGLGQGTRHHFCPLWPVIKIEVTSPHPGVGE